MVAQIPMPRVFIIDDPALNALRQVRILKMRPLRRQESLDIMNREELEAVMGMRLVIFKLTISVFLLLLLLASAITMLSSMAGRMMWWVDQVVDEVTMTDGNGLRNHYASGFPTSYCSCTSRCNLGTTSYFSSEGISS